MLSLAITKVYGWRGGLTIRGDEIIEWPFDEPIPMGEQLQELIVMGERLVTILEYTAALKRHLDFIARARDYDSEQSIISYLSSTNATWRSEAVAYLAWRDSVWDAAYNVFDLVESGTIEVPPLVEFIENLPKITWPI